MTVEKILEIARRLAAQPSEVEQAVVVYEDGFELALKGSPFGVPIPLVTEHGRAVAVIHTHPVPRTAPSLPDLQVLLRMARLGVNEPAVATVYSGGGEAVVTVYRVRSPPPPGSEELLLRHAIGYEHLSAESGFDPRVSEKQVREQHALLSRLGIVVERYRLTPAAE